MEVFKKPKQPDGGKVSIFACVPGSKIRAVRNAVVKRMKHSLKEKGLLPIHPLTIVDRDPGGGKDAKYKVIDGMHRLCACLELTREGKEEFDHVSYHPFLPCVVHVF